MQLVPGKATATSMSEDTRSLAPPQLDAQWRAAMAKSPIWQAQQAQLRQLRQVLRRPMLTSPEWQRQQEQLRQLNDHFGRKFEPQSEPESQPASQPGKKKRKKGAGRPPTFTAQQIVELQEIFRSVLKRKPEVREDRNTARIEMRDSLSESQRSASDRTFDNRIFKPVIGPRRKRKK